MRLNDRGTPQHGCCATPAHGVLQSLDYIIRGEVEQALAVTQDRPLENWSARVAPTLVWTIVTQLQTSAARDRQWRDVLKWVAVGLALQPNNDELRRQHALLMEFEVQNLLAQGDWAKLIEHYLSELRQAPDNVEHHLDTGPVYPLQARHVMSAKHRTLCCGREPSGIGRSYSQTLDFGNNGNWSVKIYGTEIADTAIDRLRSEVIPARYADYHNERTTTAANSQQYAYYAT